MSWFITGLVKRHFRGEPALKLVALTLADYSTDDGGSIFPSVARLGLETGLSDRTVQRYMRKLQELGFIELDGSAKGGTRMVEGERQGRPCRYRIAPSWLQSLGVSMSPYPDGRVTDEPRRVTKAASKGDTAVSPEPSGEPTRREKELAVRSDRASAKARCRGGVTLDEWLAACKAAGSPAVPEGDPVFAYAHRVRLDRELLELHWSCFKAAYAGTDKRYRSWLAAFRSSVRGNWYRLWYLDHHGNLSISTVGEQARRDAEFRAPTETGEPAGGSSRNSQSEGNSDRALALESGRGNLSIAQVSG